VAGQGNCNIHVAKQTQRRLILASAGIGSVPQSLPNLKAISKEKLRFGAGAHEASHLVLGFIFHFGG